MLIDCVVSFVDHKYVYGETPPVGWAIAEPLDCPLHKTWVVSITTCKAKAGSLTWKEAEAEPKVE